MSTANLSVIDQFLVRSFASSEDFERSLLSIVFADAAARAQTNERTSSDPVGDFAGAWSAALGNLGWTVRQASASQVASTRQSLGVPKQERLFHAFGKTSDALISDAEFDQTLQGLLAPEPTVVSSAQRDAMLSMMWKYGAADDEWLSFGFVQLASGDEGPLLSCVVVGLRRSSVERHVGILRPDRPINLGSWAALRQEIVPADLEFEIRQLTASVRRNQIDENLPQVRKALGNKGTDHYVLGGN